MPRTHYMLVFLFLVVSATHQSFGMRTLDEIRAAAWVLAESYGQKPGYTIQKEADHLKPSPQSIEELIQAGYQAKRALDEENKYFLADLNVYSKPSQRVDEAKKKLLEIIKQLEQHDKNIESELKRQYAILSKMCESVRNSSSKNSKSETILRSTAQLEPKHSEEEEEQENNHDDDYEDFTEQPYELAHEVGEDDYKISEEYEEKKDDTKNNKRKSILEGNNLEPNKKKLKILKQYACSFLGCEIISHWKTSMDTHEKSHTENRPEICTETNCHAAFAKKFLLKKHMVMHKVQRDYICNQCNKSFLSTSHLNKHIHTHEDPGFGCTKPNCNALFTTKEDRDRHEKQPHNKNFLCKTCKKNFCSWGDYLIHIDLHKNDEQEDVHAQENKPIVILKKDFICPTCNEGFDNKRKLTHHRLSYHTPHKFQCHDKERCGATFPYKYNLTRHNKEPHDKNKKCVKCGRFFNSIGGWQQHISKPCQKET